MTDYWTVVKRGLNRRCPKCGEGRIFTGYITLLPECPDCHESFHNIRSDDAAPWATVLIVGHFAAWVIGLMIKSDISTMNLTLIVLGFVVIGAGITLPLMKGIFVNLSWFSNLRSGGDPKDAHKETP